MVVFVALCHGFSQPVIRGTKAEGCVDGKCGSHCAWDGAKLFPGQNLNQPGKCRLLRCSDEFDIYITPCPFDSKNFHGQFCKKSYKIFFLVHGEYEWVNRDDSKSYPECCGTKQKKPF